MADEMSPNLVFLQDYLTDSLMLSTPLIKNDPAYQHLKDSIPSIIEMSMLSLGKDNIDELSATELNLLGLKSLHTIYLRLATLTAPEFDVSAEQVSFKKGDRFFHYTSLAEKVAEQIQLAELSSYVEVADIRISSRNGTVRNYNLSRNQKLNFKLNKVTTHSAELEWKMFNLSFGEFYKYSLMFSETPIYDEYSVPKIRSGNDVSVKDFYDIKRTKYRLENLKPNTTYYLVLVFHSRDGNQSIECIEVETLGLEQ